MNETLKDAMTHTVEVWWWNMGRKRLDFRGTYADYINKIGAKIRKTKDGYTCTVSTSSTTVTCKSADHDPLRALNDSIVLFLTIMGDRALFHGAHGYSRCVNVRA